MKIKILIKNKGDTMVTYVCMFCEYRFDSEKGDERYNIPAGVKIEDMPEDWECPECTQPGKDAFIIEEEQ